MNMGGSDGNGAGKAHNVGLASSGNVIADVKAKYIAALIKLFEEKAGKGELDEKLMERIERLIGASQT